MSGQKETVTETETEIPIPDKKQADSIRQTLRDMIPHYDRCGVVHIRIKNGKIAVDVDCEFDFSYDIYGIVYYTDVRVKRVFYIVVSGEYRTEQFHGYDIEMKMVAYKRYALDNMDSENQRDREKARKLFALVTVYEILSELLREYLRRYRGY